LIDGTIEPDGIELTVLTPDSRERHWRMVRNEYDICEFNVCAYFMAKDQGFPWHAIPVYLHRRFRHGFVFINTECGIEKPGDLVGRRVGGTNFQPAGNVWARGHLEETYGVPSRSITWITDRTEDVAFTPPPDLKMEMIPGDTTLDDMLVNGELDAMIAPSFPPSFLKGDPRVARLFTDHKEIEIAYYRQTGLFPIMHATVIQSAILEENPWVAASLVQAFDAAKEIAYRRVENPRVVPLAWFSSALEEQNAILGSDPWQYGLGEVNRRNLETAMGYTHQQGMTSKTMAIDDLFADTDDEELREKKSL
jgi:4,5-dihydroxyphthalate decarboxylase